MWRVTLISMVSAPAAVLASPSFTWTDITLDAGGWVTGMALHATTGRCVCRTDVGGVYALNTSGARPEGWSWRWMSGSLQGDGVWNTQGIVADNSDPSGDTWLMAVGQPNENATKTPHDGDGIYRTTDFGLTWDRVFSEDSFNGNGDERHGGEILHFSTDGSATIWAAGDTGLWVSHSKGITGSWTSVAVPVQIFDASAKTGFGGVSTSAMPTSALQADASVATRLLWVFADDTLAVSADSGTSWHSVLVAGNATLLQLQGAERVTAAQNGSTLFISAFVNHSGLTTDTRNATLEQQLGEARRSQRQAQRQHVGVNAGTTAKKQGESMLVKLTLTDGGSGPLGLDWAWTQLSDRQDAGWPKPGLKRGGGGVDLVQLIEDEKTLVAAYSDSSMGVSRDGGWTFQQKNLSLLEKNAPGWWPHTAHGAVDLSVRGTIPFGNGNFVEVEGGWMLGTGFLPAFSKDQGDTWMAVTKGLGEVCTYAPVSTAIAKKNGLTPYGITGGVMDLSMFAWAASPTSGKSATIEYSFFAHQPNRTWWVTDYCHATIVTANGDWLSFCNKQFGQAVNGRWEPGGAGQLVRSSNFGMTWSLTNSHDAVGIGNDVTFVDISQNPEDPDDIVVTGSSPYSPWVVPANSSNHSFWEGGVRRTRDGGRTWLLSANTTAIKGFMGSYYSPEDNLVRDAVEHNTLYLMNDVAGISSSTDGGDTWHSCPSPYSSGFNGKIASWTGRTDGKSALLAMGGTGETGEALKVSYDSCQTWQNLHNKSLFSWQYGMAGPCIDAHQDTIVAWAAPGPDLQPDTVHSDAVDPMEWPHGSFFASKDLGVTWEEISPPDPSKSKGSLPGPRAVANPSGVTVDPEDPSVIWIATGGRSYSTVKLA